MNKIIPTVNLQPGVGEVLSAVVQGEFKDLRAYRLQLTAEAKTKAGVPKTAGYHSPHPANRCTKTQEHGSNHHPGRSWGLCPGFS
jgi:hypothetical protein